MKASLPVRVLCVFLALALCFCIMACRASKRTKTVVAVTVDSSNRKKLDAYTTRIIDEQEAAIDQRDEKIRRLTALNEALTRQNSQLSAENRRLNEGR